MCVCIYVCDCAHMCESVHVCGCVSGYVCVHVRRHYFDMNEQHMQYMSCHTTLLKGVVCNCYTVLSIRENFSVYVCMYVCMYVYTHAYVRVRVCVVWFVVSRDTCPPHSYVFTLQQ